MKKLSPRDQRSFDNHFKMCIPEINVEDVEDELEELYEKAKSTIRTFNMTMDEYKELLLKEIKKYEEEQPETTLKLISMDHKLSKEERDIVSRFRWFSVGDGKPQLIYKVSNTNETYIHLNYSWGEPKISGLVGILSSICPYARKKKNIYSSLEDKYVETYQKLHKANKLSRTTIYGCEIKGKKDAKTITTKPFHEWLKVVLDYVITDERFRISEQPKTLATDPTQPAYCHFDLSLLKDGPTPNFDMWSSIMTEDQKEIFLAWIYGVLDIENTSRAALWLTDDGYSGKSRFIIALSKFIMSSSAVGKGLVQTINKDSLEGNFGLAKAFGARLLSYSDCKNDRILQSERVHGILGNDEQSIEFKGKDSFSVQLNAKLLVASNTKPSINTKYQNELTRVIVLNLQPLKLDVLKKICLLDKKGMPAKYKDGKYKFIGGNLDELLLPEMPHILYKAKEMYEKWCPRRGDYVIPDSVRDDMMSTLGSSEECDFAEFILENLEFHPKDRISRSKLGKMFVEQVSKNKIDFTNFKRFIGTYGVKEITVYEDAGDVKIGQKYFEGVRSKHGISGKPLITRRAQ